MIVPMKLSLVLQSIFVVPMLAIDVRGSFSQSKFPAKSAACVIVAATTTFSPLCWAETIATRYFSGGDARLLQPAFEDMKYQGVKEVKVGTLQEVSTVQVTYDSDRLNYKQLLGKYWRSIDPTDDEGQFSARGRQFRPIIWVTNTQEKKDAEYSGKRMEDIDVYKKPFKTSIIQLAGDSTTTVFTPLPTDQDFYKLQPNEYKKVTSSRDKFFTETYKPIKTTACEGNICGYVYFPCSDENGCLDIVNGKWQ